MENVYIFMLIGNEQLYLPFYRRTQDGEIVYKGNLGCLTDDCKYWNDRTCKEMGDLCKLPPNY